MTIKEGINPYDLSEVARRIRTLRKKQKVIVPGEVNPYDLNEVAQASWNLTGHAGEDPPERNPSEMNPYDAGQVR